MLVLLVGEMLLLGSPAILVLAAPSSGFAKVAVGSMLTVITSETIAAVRRTSVRLLLLSLLVKDRRRLFLYIGSFSLIPCCGSSCLWLEIPGQARNDGRWGYSRMTWCLLLEVSGQARNDEGGGTSG